MAGTSGRYTGWKIATNVCIVALLLPLVWVISRAFTLDLPGLTHTITHLLPKYLTNTGVLLLGVCLVSLVVGISTAWYVSVYHFPFRKYLEWLLILPLSIPTFINAISYSGLTDYAGPVRIFLRRAGWDTSLDIMHMSGAIFVMSMVLYPYVYVGARGSFLNQSATLIEASRSLGRSLFYTFFKVVLPLAWPAVFAGLMLVIMEVLNDYGVVAYYGIPTFTTGIFRSWLALGDLPTATFLSAVILLFVLTLFILEHNAKGGNNLTFDKTDRKIKRTPAKYKWLMFFWCSLPLLLGFMIPVGQLLWWLSLTYKDQVIAELWLLTQHTATLGLLSSLVIVILSIIIGYTFRITKRAGIRKLLQRLPMLGYAMPGAVIGVGVIGLVLWVSPQLIYVGTAALVFGYVIRFFAVGYGGIEAGLGKVPPQIDDAAHSMGSPPLRNLLRIHLPLLKISLVGALLMVFVDVSKELPLTLILRPFNFETLATHAFQYAKDEMAPESASSSLIIIFISAIPVYILNKILKIA